MPLENFTSREDKFQSFFGPGVTANVQETEQACAAPVNTMAAG